MPPCSRRGSRGSSKCRRPLRCSRRWRRTSRPARRSSTPAPRAPFQIADAPNNPSYLNNTQWYLDGSWGINAPGAWSVTTGSSQVIVADTDTGIGYNNTELLNNLWINQAEIPSSVRPNLTDTNGDGLITLADLNASVSGVMVNQGPGKIKPTTTGGLVNGAAVIAPDKLRRLVRRLDPGRRRRTS